MRIGYWDEDSWGPRPDDAKPAVVRPRPRGWPRSGRSWPTSGSTRGRSASGIDELEAMERALRAATEASMSDSTSTSMSDGRAVRAVPVVRDGGAEALAHRPYPGATGAGRGHHEDDRTRSSPVPDRRSRPWWRVAVGLALDRAYAPTLFTRSDSHLGDRLAILAIILTPLRDLGAHGPSQHAGAGPPAAIPAPGPVRVVASCARARPGGGRRVDGPRDEGGGGAGPVTSVSRPVTPASAIVKGRQHRPLSTRSNASISSSEGPKLGVDLIRQPPKNRHIYPYPSPSGSFALPVAISAPRPPADGPPSACPRAADPVASLSLPPTPLHASRPTRTASGPRSSAAATASNQAMIWPVCSGAARPAPAASGPAGCSRPCSATTPPPACTAA